MKMNPIKNKSVKGNMSSLLFILVFMPLFNLSAQNYVESGYEFYTENLGYSFSTSSVWQTNRSATPGYYSWGNGATSYTGLGAANNINGYVKKYGVDAFVFPIGTGTEIRTLSIASSSGNATDAYAAAWIAGDPTSTPDPTNANAFHSTTAFSGTIIGVSPLGQWDWQAISGTGAGLGITVSIPAISSTGAFTYPANLRLVGWDNATSKWVSLGTIGATALANYTPLSGTMIPGIDAIGIGAVCGAGTNYPTIQ